MKIKEFIEKVNKHDGMRAKDVEKGIVIGTPNNMGIFSIPEDATNFIEIDTWATSNSLYWKKADREYLSSLIEELLHTPVKERFPEKKYLLATMRYIEGPTTIKQYVSDIIDGYDHVSFYFGSKENAGEWTDSDLNYLSQYFSKEAIDAMKEPAEDGEYHTTEAPLKEITE